MLFSATEEGEKNKMGKFSGILICSDIDGTFFAPGDVAVVNGKAIEYFISEGGKFTFSTGRMINHLREKEFTRFINAPACVCNGSIVFDYSCNKVLKESGLNFTVGDFLRFMNGNKQENARIYYCGSSDDTGITEVKNYQYAGIYEKYNFRPLKIMCEYASAKEAEDFKQFVCQTLEFPDVYISKSWAMGVEFNSTDATKGAAAEFIKNSMDGIHTLIGVGDYENDIPLIEKADIGVAVGDAIEAVKKCADIVVKPCREYSIRDLIEKIENGIIKI